MKSVRTEPLGRRMPRFAESVRGWRPPDVQCRLIGGPNNVIPWFALRKPRRHANSGSLSVTELEVAEPLANLGNGLLPGSSET